MLYALNTFGVDQWITESFPTIRVVLIVLLALCGIMIVACILLQQGNSEGLGAISGGSETFFGKNKGKTLEGKLRKLTVGFSIAMLVLVLFFFITVVIYPLASAPV